MASSSPVLRVPPNVRLRGANIIPDQAAHTGYEPHIWASMWSIWDWDGWLKPQIDDAKALGCNTIRFFGSMMVFTYGFITESTYLNRWTQLLDYCAAQGLYVCPTGSDIYPDGWWPDAAGVTPTQAGRHYGKWAGLLARYPNVIGVDLMNEAWGIPAGNPRISYDWMLAAMQACAKPVRAKGLPVTISFPTNTGLSPWGWTGGIFDTFPPGPFFELTDFLDIHIYLDSTPADVASTYDFPWAHLSNGSAKPMIFGEFGMNADQSSTARTDFYNMVKSLVTARGDNAGALAWSSWDSNTTDNQYGLYSAPGVVRDDIAAAFAAFPTTR